VAAPVALLQHDELGPPGWLDDVLTDRHVEYRVIRLYAGEALPTDYSAVVSLGGSMSATDEEAYPFLADEKRLLRAAVDRARPVLGICLGCQLLADGLGGRVFPGARPEIGYVPVRLNPAGREDPVLRLAGDAVLSFHSDTWTPPPGAQLLAETDAYPQAFRVGSALGIQFHPEPAAALVEQWVLRHADDLRRTGIDPAGLTAQARNLEAQARRSAFAFFGAWLDHNAEDMPRRQ